MIKSEYWNNCHNKALNLLTKGYKSLEQLKQEYGENSIVAFDDLVIWGYAERWIKPIFNKHNQLCGTITYYRLK